MKVTPWMLSVSSFAIVVALCSGYAVTILMADYDQRVAVNSDVRSGEQPTSPPTTTRTRIVPVLLTDVQPGSRISASIIGEAPVLVSRLQGHRDSILRADVIAGRLAKTKIPAATPLRLSMFHPIDRKPEVRMPADLRLVSVEFTDQQGLIGQYLQAGSYVDVMLTQTTADEIQGSSVRQLFDGVRVYSVFEKPGHSGPIHEVILELKPEQQGAMLLASSIGRVSLTYNPAGPGESGVAISSHLNEFTSEDLQVPSRNLLEDDPLNEEYSPPFMTEQFRNGQRSVSSYNRSRLGNDLHPKAGNRVDGDSD